MGSGASIYIEQLYLDIDTSGLSSDESMEDNDTIDTFLTNDSMDSELFLSEDVDLGCFGHFYKSALQSDLHILPEDVLLTFTKVIYKSDLQKRALGITQVEHHQRQVDGHANQACDDQGEVHDKIAMKYPQ
jgi:hypothetical protein